MFEKLYKLVFGLDEFTKTKIELRLDLAKEVAQKLQVTSVDDFDLLESCIYKIKDQLRVKSSNLNNVIRDKQKDLDKKSVEDFLHQLLHLRDSFLNSAFKALKDRGEISVVGSEQSPFQNQLEINSSSNTSLEFSTKTYHLEIISKGGFHVQVTFFEKVDYLLLRTLSIVLYDELQAQGTSIIIEGLQAKVIPRTQNDNILLPLPQHKNEKLVDEAFLALTYKGDDKREYATSISKKPDVSTQYYQEESLDSMIANYDKNAKNYPKHHVDDKEESIEVETEKTPITVEKNTQTPQEISSYGDKKKYVLYKDDQIIATLNSTSGVFGHITISPITKKNISQLKESEFSYLILFTKIFSSIVFEVVQAHGTTINWKSEGDGIEIIPRFKDDGVIGEWSAKEFSNEQLEEIQHLLLQKLSGSTKEEAKPSQEVPVESKKEPEKTPTKEKAKFLLDELRKIP